MYDNMNFKIVYYETINGNCPVKEYVDELAKDNNNFKILAKINMYINKLSEFGYLINTKYKRNAIKQLENEIYELRPDNTRVLYFYCNADGSYVLLHAFTKKTDKTPPNEIQKAINEMKDYIRRYTYGEK